MKEELSQLNYTFAEPTIDPVCASITAMVGLWRRVGKTEDRPTILKAVRNNVHDLGLPDELLALVNQGINGRSTYVN